MTPRLALMAAMALVLAGCIERGPDAGGDDAEDGARDADDATGDPPGRDDGADDAGPAPTGDRAPSPDAVALPLRVVRLTHLSEEGTGFEPSVSVAPDGTIYVTAAQGVSVPTFPSSRLWVSHDDGASFTEIAAIDPDTGVSNLPSGAEGDVAVDAAGTSYFVDLTEAIGTAVSRSTDGGETWELRSANAFAVPVGDREWIAAGDAGTVAITWNQIPTGLWIVVSTDGGLTFPVQTYVPGYPMASVFAADSPSEAAPIDIGPAGEIYTVRSRPDGVVLIRSLDGGLTFDEHLVRATEARTDFLTGVPTSDAEGTVYVAWVEDVGGNGDVFYAQSRDQGETWGAPVQVSSHGGSSAFPWIDAGGAGHVSIAYVGAPGARGLSDDTDANWYVYVTDVHDAAGPMPRIATALVTPEPVQGGTVCTQGLLCSEGRELGDYLEVAVGPDGGAHVAWSDQREEVWWAKVAAGQ